MLVITYMKPNTENAVHNFWELNDRKSILESWSTKNFNTDYLNLPQKRGRVHAVENVIKWYKKNNVFFFPFDLPSV